MPVQQADGQMVRLPRGQRLQQAHDPRGRVGSAQPSRVHARRLAAPAAIRRTPIRSGCAPATRAAMPATAPGRRRTPRRSGGRCSSVREAGCHRRTAAPAAARPAPRPPPPAAPRQPLNRGSRGRWPAAPNRRRCTSSRPRHCAPSYGTASAKPAHPVRARVCRIAWMVAPSPLELANTLRREAAGRPEQLRRPRRHRPARAG